jgi:hypothetical protein
VVGGDAIEVVAQLSEFRQIDGTNPLVKQGVQNAVIPVYRFDDSQAKGAELSSVAVMIAAFAPDAAEFHIAASVRKNIPADDTSSPLFPIFHNLRCFTAKL